MSSGWDNWEIPSRRDIVLRIADITVEFDNGYVIGWEDKARDILEQAGTGHIPRVLRITGFTFRIKLRAQEFCSIGVPLKLFSHHYQLQYYNVPHMWMIRPLHLKVAQSCYGLPVELPSSAGDSQEYYEFTCLLFDSLDETYHELAPSKEYQAFRVMLLHHNEEEDTYERINWLHLSLRKPLEWSFEPGSEKFPDPTWKMETIRLA
ncbi:hypothetical protein QBC38DRAFT_208235 [Podospora fimiseda]|uniref:Uncharacterized protein n=1 Tax=Podospora fimiseda TaxID=252190 RepID=A0AAN7BPD7_9PEZI|nr:hypothetical protein QBC38DRAFT_208235 [Podospora fimiseda]